MKKFKDPIYGYIEVDGEIVGNIIDTPVFQRLKNIRQTSYAPLYPSAHHNRFTHSLGVYHLGQIAFHSIERELKNKAEKTIIEDRIPRIKKLFGLACLLHDVGHAPFSHTGEVFFLDEQGCLYEELKREVGEDCFSRDFNALGTKKPAPHECMSCIVALRAFPSCFDDAQERAFFARCIIGLLNRSRDKKPIQEKGEEYVEYGSRLTQYKNMQKIIGLENCVIQILNSSIIDVDRLDYIIRDAATIGFQNAQIDYMRLLNGCRIIQMEEEWCIGYHKSAISVIESAIYAHDSEKKWIQSHPVILYEMEALKSAVKMLASVFEPVEQMNPLFCYNALTEQGITLFYKGTCFNEEIRGEIQREEWFKEQGEEYRSEMLIPFSVNLLADEDLLYLIKRFCKNGFGYEYFTRNARRSAVWKSESEFRFLFQKVIGDGSEKIKKLENGFKELSDYCERKTGEPIVNQKVLEELTVEEVTAKSKIEDKDTQADILKGLAEKKAWMEVLKELSEELSLEFEFLILPQNKFNSSFKETIGEIPILFYESEDKAIKFRDVVDVLQSSKNKISNFFHLYYKSKTEVTDDDKKHIVDAISNKLLATIPN